MTFELDYENIDSICNFRSRKYNKHSEKNKHGQRVLFLLKSAEFFSVTNPNLSRLYIKELVEICEKHLIRLMPSVKRKFCKGCYSYFVDGMNSIFTMCDNSLDSASKTSSNESKLNKNNLICVKCLVCTRTRRYGCVK